MFNTTSNTSSNNEANVKLENGTLISPRSNILFSSSTRLFCNITKFINYNIPS